MSDFSRTSYGKFPQISRTDELYPKGSGVQYAKNPRKLWSLVDLGASSSVLVVAFALADHTSMTGHYPTFEVKRSNLAKMTGLSERQVSIAIDFMTMNNVLSVHYRHGSVNRYSWSEAFLSTSENISPVLVKNLQGSGENISLGTGENISPLYIEFILDLFYKSSFKEFFAEQERFYTFYIPAKRQKNSVQKVSGETITVSRKEAWKDAVYYVFEKIKDERNPLTRIYLALNGAYRIDDVKFPKKALLYRVKDYASINEARSLSHIKEHLHDDELFKMFINEKGGTNGNAQRLH